MVCWPTVGAGARYELSNVLRRGPRCPGSRRSPATGCSSHWVNPRSASCGQLVLDHLVPHRRGQHARGEQTRRRCRRGRVRRTTARARRRSRRARPAGRRRWSGRRRSPTSGSPSTPTSARHSSSEVIESATHCSWPAHAYTPCGVPGAPRLPVALEQRAVRRPCDDRLGGDVQRHLGHRHLDQLALARAVAVLQRGQHRERAVDPGDRVDGAAHQRLAAGSLRSSTRCPRPARWSARSHCGRATGRRARTPGMRSRMTAGLRANRSWYSSPTLPSTRGVKFSTTTSTCSTSRSTSSRPSGFEKSMVTERFAGVGAVERGTELHPVGLGRRLHRGEAHAVGPRRATRP